MSFIKKDLRNNAGPVALAYETSSSQTAVIIGPTAGGKTEASVRRILRAARSQHPSPRDGVRKARIVCVGNTYRDLWDKAIPSYCKVFNPDIGKWQGGRGDPASHIMDWVVHEKQTNDEYITINLHVEVWFRAKSSEQSIEDFVRGLETTCWWLQEMDQLNENIVSLAINRVGRYPEPDDRLDPDVAKAMGLPPALAGVWGDTNMPVVGSWLYKKAFVDKEFGDGLFIQPPALLQDGRTNPKAENLHNLRKIHPMYYVHMSKDLDEYDRRRLLQMDRVFDRRGQPVHPLFNQKHEAGGLRFDPSLPLIIACDTGPTLKSAAVFMQPQGTGIVALDEVSPFERQITIDEFAQEIMHKLNTRFAGARFVTMVVDPAAAVKINTETRMGVGKYTYAQYLAGLTGLDVVLAETNDPNQRIAALDHYLDKTDGFYIDPLACPHTAAALNGGYAWRKIKDASVISVMKNDYSHLGEAAEYGAQLCRGGVMSHSDMKNNMSQLGAYDTQAEF